VIFWSCVDLFGFGVGIGLLNTPSLVLEVNSLSIYSRMNWQLSQADSV